jgi:hypothetical protein
MKKFLVRSALVGAIVLFAGCGGSASTVSETVVPEADAGFYSSEYPTEVETTFINSCIANGGNASSCQCVFDYIADQVSFERFTAIETEIQNGAGVEDFPIFSNAFESCTE